MLQNFKEIITFLFHIHSVWRKLQKLYQLAYQFLYLHLILKLFISPPSFSAKKKSTHLWITCRYVDLFEPVKFLILIYYEGEIGKYENISFAFLMERSAKKISTFWQMKILRLKGIKRQTILGEKFSHGILHNLFRIR